MSRATQGTKTHSRQIPKIHWYFPTDLHPWAFPRWYCWGELVCLPGREALGVALAWEKGRLMSRTSSKVSPRNGMATFTAEDCLETCLNHAVSCLG